MSFGTQLGSKIAGLKTSEKKKENTYFAITLMLRYHDRGRTILRADDFYAMTRRQRAALGGGEEKRAWKKFAYLYIFIKTNSRIGRKTANTRRERARARVATD